MRQAAARGVGNACVWVMSSAERDIMGAPGVWAMAGKLDAANPIVAPAIARPPRRFSEPHIVCRMSMSKNG